jgi:alkylation response protein AidB-like acyl-CoA dehydrogenase
MRFALDDEQRGFARSLDDLLAAADVPAVARAWAGGDHDAGLKLWRRLADLGVTGLLVPEDAGGLGATPVEAVIAWEALGRHAVPGPWVETAVVTRLLADGPVGGTNSAGTDGLLGAVADGSAVATLAAPPWTPYALDADTATHVLHLEDGVLRTAQAGDAVRSVDPVRRLHRILPAEELVSVAPDVAAAALDTGALLAAAQLLGLGEALLERSVEYVKQRRQFGRVIGEYQALKHALADVRIGLDFARPLVWGAAVAMSPGRDVTREVSGAKVAASDAAWRAARTALQVHGAIGYTAEYDLSLWLLKARALAGAWGSPREHRTRILASLVEPTRSVEPVETREA